MGLEIDPRDQILQSLRGNTLKIPDLQALLQHWPQYVNLEVDRLRRYVDKKLRAYVISCLCVDPLALD